MARVTYGALVTDIRGSLGGTTFQRNKYGSSAKNKSNPGNSGTTFQTGIRQAVRYVTQLWSQLSETDRNLWNSFATTYPQPVKNNPSVNMSGYAVFLKFNVLWYMRVGYTANTPSFTLSTLPTISPTIQLSGGFLFFNDNSATTDLLTVLMFSVSAPIRQSINYAKNRVRYMGFCYASGDGLNFETAYSNQYGRLPVVGDWVFLKVSPMGLNAPYFWADQYFKIQITS